LAVNPAAQGIPLDRAAAALGIRTGTLRRWVREGCPVVVRGRRGRGQAALVDPQQVREWREAGAREQAALALAGAVPLVLAGATVEAWRCANGLDKRRLAGVLAATWYMQTTGLLDYLREQCPSVPDVGADSVPHEIETLQKIAR